MGVVQFPQSQQGLQPFPPGLADAYEDAGGERHPRLPRRGDAVQARLGALVRRTVMGAAFAAQPLRAALQHQTLGGGHAAQGFQLGAGQDAGVQVRQQAGLIQHPLGGFPEVRQR